ncbi:MAG: family 10 glycosylhydrolase [Firmicutes bacterium]|nr:family 10 glycosylhydrolase [Bacillota bacterium]
MVRELLAVLVSALVSLPGASVAMADIEVEPPPTRAIEQRAVETVAAPTSNTDRDFRGVWVATVINLDFPSRAGLSNAEIMQEIDYIVQHSRSVGMNAIVLQVRPAGDALYPSAIFPWSKYLTGEQGLAPPGGFDPLAYWIEQSHANGLELHAWVNPYRVTHSTSQITDVNQLAANNPARLNPHLVVQHSNALYFDPGRPEARQIILDGIAELLHNYNIDGIHFDDYFYPARDFNDAASFAMYGAGQTLHDWRVANVNTLVYSVRELIDEIRPSVKFGISPTGIWANSSTTPLGSNTRGYQHYIEISADSRRWIQEGWIDYIIPQIYWHIGFDIADYATLLRWWEDVVRGTNVGLHIGHAAWREHENQANFNGEILRQLQMNEASDVVTGSVFFRWASLRGSVGETLRNWYAARPQSAFVPGEFSPSSPGTAGTAQRPPVMLMDSLTIGLPTGNVNVPGGTAGHTIVGTSVPHLPLFMNGELVTNRTSEGFFSVFPSLADGENVFEFTQEGLPSVSRTITRGAAPPPAPPATDTPAPTPTPTPVQREYSEPYYAVITANNAWLFPNAAVTGGSSQLLQPGTTDRIVGSARDGSWLLLSNGGWIEADSAEQNRERSVVENILRGGTFARDGHLELISWQISRGAPPIVRTVFEENELTLYFGMHTAPPQMNVAQPPETSLFESMHSGVTEDGIPYITFVAREDSRINGYYLSEVNTRLRLTVMSPRPLYQNWRTPFNGFTFVIDPGHGGSDYGAIGPMGRDLAEKHIVLANSEKLAERLEFLGAEVILTRDNNDDDLTLHDRVLISHNVMPDMFISMHANSIAETTNAEDIRGFTVWYRNETSHFAAATFLDRLHDVNPLSNRWIQTNQANFYVCRPSWTPSILLEASFMPNIEDFAWMIDPANQNQMADDTVAALMDYFMR